MLGLHAFRRMHRVVTNALCSVATFVALSQTALSQASDLQRAQSALAASCSLHQDVRLGRVAPPEPAVHENADITGV